MLLAERYRDYLLSAHATPRQRGTFRLIVDLHAINRFSPEHDAQPELIVWIAIPDLVVDGGQPFFSIVSVCALEPI